MWKALPCRSLCGWLVCRDGVRVYLVETQASPHPSPLERTRYSHPSVGTLAELVSPHPSPLERTRYSHPSVWTECLHGRGVWGRTQGPKGLRPVSPPSTLIRKEQPRSPTINTKHIIGFRIHIDDGSRIRKSRCRARMRPKHQH